MTGGTAGPDPPSVRAMTFTGFPDAALVFFEGLGADNSKAYWTDHRTTYEQAVRDPMVALLDALEPEFGPARLLRPYRDTRFSADTPPYWTQAAALVPRGTAGGSLSVQLDAAGLVVGGGASTLSRDQLGRYRAAVGADPGGAQLVALTDALGAEGFTLRGERLRRAPRGTDPAHPRIELLRHRRLVAGRDLGVQPWLSGPECLDVVAHGWRAVLPLLAWLDRHVGPAEEALSPAARGGTARSHPAR